MNGYAISSSYKLDCQQVQVEAVKTPPSEVEADAICVGIFEGDKPPDWLDERARNLIDSGLAKTKEGSVTTVHGDERHLLLVGLGKEEEFDTERARVAAANCLDGARKVKAARLGWAVPDSVEQEETAAALAEGAVLASYSFERYKSDVSNDDEASKVEKLIISSSADIGTSVDFAVTVARSQNAARELQNLPANEATPAYLAEHAEGLAGEIDGLKAEILGKKAITEKSMGGILSVARGSDNDPQLIVMRYEGKKPKGDLLGFVGKAITFDTGGYSIKPSAKMHEMKMDMSGGGAVIEATAAIARLQLPVKVVSVVPATENMISGRATRPGDIVKTYSGKTVEVINTDAEGRMVLADALAYAAELGADRIVDLATLTGAIVIALGSTYAGLVSNDDDLADALSGAGNSTGELIWRLPMHEEYLELTKGKITDLVNASDAHKASPLYAAAFLEQFVDGKPWAHIDIAGTSWDVGRSYVGKGATGFGVRLLVEFARSRG